MTFPNEIREDFLVEGGRAEIHYSARNQEAIHNIRRDYDVAKPQGGEEDFAESPDVDHSGVGVEALQGCDGLAFIAVLAIVVVFDDPGSGALCPLDQLKAARGTHGDAEWELVGRRNKSRSRVAALRDTGSNVETFFIHGNRYWCTAIQFEDVSRQAITGFLNPDTSSRVEQDSSGNLQRLLGTADDQDLLWVAADASVRFLNSWRSHGEESSFPIRAP